MNSKRKIQLGMNVELKLIVNTYFFHKILIGEKCLYV